MASLEERILSYLREHQGASPREIADALGEPIQRVRLALLRLRDAGVVVRGEEGRYYVVAWAVRGRGARELRRNVRVNLEEDITALWERVGELELEVKRLREELEELKRRCSC